ncbi:MAG: tryptophan synthase subunit alpha [Niabella sp.]
MSRLKNVFNKGKKILNVYCTAGYPALDSTLKVMLALEKSGADIIELGMPYSDPVADGETIQHSSSIALENGMTIATLFGQLKNMRNEISIPVVLMGYLNPVMQYGIEKFCEDAANAGVDGFIIPDLPAHEFEIAYKPIFEKYGLDFVFLVTPETSEARVRQLDGLSSGFLYAVSSSSTTGHDKDFSLVEKYLQRLKSYHLKNPVLVGFGISDKESFERVCQYADGAIIGSAYIKALDKTTDINQTTKTFVDSVLE